jgi:hypothetical protein
MRHMPELPDLVRRSKEGAVLDREIDRVAEILAADEGGSDTYQLLYVIARSDVRAHEELVARFLDYREDPMVARLALQTLCTFWGLAGRYREQIERFIKGVDWDIIGDVRQVAMTAAGKFLREYRNHALLQELLRLTDPANTDKLERRIAIEAIAYALGDPIEDTLGSGKGTVELENWSENVVSRGMERLSGE